MIKFRINTFQTLKCCDILGLIEGGGNKGIVLNLTNHFCVLLNIYNLICYYLFRIFYLPFKIFSIILKINYQGKINKINR